MIRPLLDKVAIRRELGKDKTDGGLFIPENAKEKTCEGTVLAVGPGRFAQNGARIEPAVKVGDKVLFSKYGGTEVKLDGEDVLLIAEGEIHGVLSGE